MIFKDIFGHLLTYPFQVLNKLDPKQTGIRLEDVQFIERRNVDDKYDEEATGRSRVGV